MRLINKYPILRFKIYFIYIIHYIYTTPQTYTYKQSPSHVHLKIWSLLCSADTDTNVPEYCNPSNSIVAARLRRSTAQ